MPRLQDFWVKMDNHSTLNGAPAKKPDTTPELLTVIQYLLLVPVTEIALRVFGFKRCWQILARLSIPARPRFGDAAEARTMLRGLRRAKTLSPLFGRCLARSLVLWWQLHRRGISVTLYIGVRKKINFRAHAWLELEEKPLNAGPAVHSRYGEIGKFCHPKELT